MLVDLWLRYSETIHVRCLVFVLQYLGSWLERFGNSVGRIWKCVVYHIILSSVDGHLICFYVLAIVNNAAMNIGVHVSFQFCFIFPGYVSRNGIAGSYNNFLVF